MTYDLMTFTKHGPSMHLTINSKQPAGNSLAPSTAGTAAAGGTAVEREGGIYNSVSKIIENTPGV